ncbi:MULTISPECIES: bifunctional 2-keto-4-hydroxyglutarate aldolase/2-keto-3-deoxy-6-phosphogluconate aldolase [Paenibacillus]|uniref:Bifunctional 2-keto-4-hydroxyglutarate aldolase/2-keto-3-deoxy-6-phosphogluconate aldolase n=1 Tax=Paenibacillus campinasensis TaxID=66347 RepID=A0A268EPB5_9BACL|nr:MULTISPECIES: bifunctional 2-keto-4-hydroxyglutarate aldolase/2-keto-3-deoxy-6-phosphogluconate aldolase [Paenibacillus]MUG66134.1 bifunctional 4-hydroxy-2-oxoglutarate aldolase/2-dehydro-3-deoxy-phosphogluconate aldolase [Paenibacillus campinasensis]PAD74967.1 bifunctional 2-keto-4-hydroxyglutarate aldolase/2-keto-3-deoxy-6-phosphogluconate aldolase [Paenibacillus campinasensis]PAK50201.1 bifunctional 2-keto-4-hydroxyglutarate aldolase/2-keto-3-deoxy-6-phosphogluconate aldolase [Paenibacillu
MKKLRLIQQIQDAGVVAVLRGDSPEEVIRMAEKAIEGGIKVIEVTMTVPFANEAITALAKKYTSSDPEADNYAIIGAGTVLDSETARITILAGAEFVVSPGFDRDTIMLCNRYRVPVMPGAVTVHDIVASLELGVDVVKLFPGNLYSPSVIPSLKGPLPQANIMPTGGVNLDNLHEWIQAGAFAVGIGSDLTKDALKTGNYDLIADKADAYMKAFDKATAFKKAKARG